jgi:dCMP deaminase
MTTSRPPFLSVYMRLAENLAERSTCRRLHVGCAIVSPDFRKVLSVGYNGNASGLPNDCDRTGDDAVGHCGCLHAEENAVISCDSPRVFPKVVLCTHLPCVMCAKRIINLGGVQQVVYLHDYRIKTSIELLEQASIRCNQFEVSA